MKAFGFGFGFVRAGWQVPHCARWVMDVEAWAQEQDSDEGHCCCLVVALHSAREQPVVEASVVPVVAYFGSVGHKEPFHGRNRASASIAVWGSAPLRLWWICNVIFVGIIFDTVSRKF